MIAFDEPSRESQNLTFEERYEKLLVIPRIHPFLISFFTFFLFIMIITSLDSFIILEVVAARFLCTNKETLKKAVNRVVEDDVGEGVILRMPKSPYIHGRTDALVKIKV